MTPNMVTVVDEVEVVYDPRVSVFVLGQLRTIAYAVLPLLVYLKIYNGLENNK